MGTNHSVSSQSSKNTSVSNSSNSTPEKEKISQSSLSSSKTTAEELILSANDLIETGRREVKEINEAQYSTYSILGYQNRLSQQSSVGEDLHFFITILENQLYLQNSKNNLNCNLANSSSIYSNFDAELITSIVTKAEMLMKLVNLSRSSFINCQSLILKSAQLIEYIEIIEQREKKLIKQKGLKKQLDQAQSDLNDTSNILEQYLIQKLQISSTFELDKYQLRLQKIQSFILQLIQAFKIDDDMSVHEIPCELD